jgi:hypothetical protein
MTLRGWPAPPGFLTPPRIPGACPTTPHTQEPTTGQFTCYQKRTSSLAIDTKNDAPAGRGPENPPPILDAWYRIRNPVDPTRAGQEGR